VGGHLLELLLAEEAYGGVTALGRRALGRQHRKLAERVVDFRRLAEIEDFPAAEDVFCCLGSTIGRAGSREAFREVDHDYVLELARRSLAAGARQFLIVTSMGSDPTAPLFYCRVKGDVERALKQLPFEALQILQPSVLLGRREVARPRERLMGAAMSALALLLLGPLRKYRPISGKAVALAMLRVALDAPAGIHVYESDRIAELARGDGEP
jgi:uncharacterized protein YbjT (DUF2867 family)